MANQDILAALVVASEPSQAPGRIEFAAYRDGKLIPASGADHLVWDIAIGKDQTATLYMHKDAYAELLRMTNG